MSIKGNSLNSTCEKQWIAGFGIRFATTEKLSWKMADQQMA